ncbi:MAG: metallophosphoesterase [Sphaerochaeta sp.]
MKGLQAGEKGKSASIVLRALSPLPSLTIQALTDGKISLLVENVNPDVYAKSIATENLMLEAVSANTVQIDFIIKTGETIILEPILPSNLEEDKFVILGDNRDGYDTFGQIIQQTNALKPLFVIDNGDLVFSGKPNQYRLFDKMVSSFSTTLCTTLGNHDIRRDGRDTYTLLYGPAYYSFDWKDTHFVFTDSSRGWGEREAIPEEQYLWLEKDLAKAQGKQIFVVTHIPPTDPRSGTTENTIPNFINEVKNGNSWIERKLDAYNASMSMNHGFQNPLEAERFEKLMSTYNVDTVYLSHIHSYLEYDKGGVHYIITGGAGAELLTQNSYYHYLVAKMGGDNTNTLVELPSPPNYYLSRYGATIQLFADALFEENPISLTFLLLGFAILLILLLLKMYLWKTEPLNLFWKWLHDSFIYSVNHFKYLFLKKPEA